MGQFLAFKLNFFDNFWPKKSFFVLKLSPSLFFWPEMLLFFLFFENWSIFGLKQRSAAFLARNLYRLAGWFD